VHGASGNTIGFSHEDAQGLPCSATACNVIARNRGAGVAIGAVDDGSAHPRFNSVRGNEIRDNGGLGIDLPPTGPDDADDPDGPADPGPGADGANDLLQMPVRLSSRPVSRSRVRVAGRLAPPVASDFRVDIYENKKADPTGFGEGATWRATAVPRADGRFSVEIDAADTATFAATVTDAQGNTSEFSESTQRKPIIFIHGFAGSKLACGENELWVPTLGNVTNDLLDLRLDADGDSPHPDACPSNTAGIVADSYGSPVYEPALESLKRTAPDDHRVYVWDWRRDPRAALAGLDAEIDAALAATRQRREGTNKVVLMGHSMGGLVIRSYINDPARARRVARAVTIGTPYWGAPKAIFPLAAGIENPAGGVLNWLVAGSPANRQAFQELARNLAGLYFLFPSENYGAWLRLVQYLTRNDLEAYVERLGGNRALLAQALDAHKTELDGFRRNGVDFRVFVGTGRNTVGEVTLRPGSRPPVNINWVNGDGTVPELSATQGQDFPFGQPLGDDVPISYVCGIDHVPLAGHPSVTEPIEDFLRYGDEPPVIRDRCENGGASSRG
jgi:pimeloyl-ACP methyl ester carboxylesterase